MALQTVINGSLVPGIVGEFSDGAVKEGRAYIVQASAAAVAPTFGNLFSFVEKTVDTSTGEKRTEAVMGLVEGAALCGILVNPKEHYIVGFNVGRTIPANTVATIACKGHIWVCAKTSVKAGADVYADANGYLGDATLSSGTKIAGAKWLRTATLADDATEVLAEVAIDEPAVVTE